MYNTTNNNQPNQEETDFLDFYLKESSQNTPVQNIASDNSQNTPPLKNQTQENTEINEFHFQKENNIENTQEQFSEIKTETEVETNISEETTNSNIITDNKHIDETKVELINKLLNNIEDNVKTIKNLIAINDNDAIESQQPKEHFLTQLDKLNISQEQTNYQNHKIIKGIFDGEKMIGENGKEYSMAANYISKSKLVQGDKLKLTIKQDGTFVYKRIDQVERMTIISKLEVNPEGKYFIRNHDQQWRVLKASVTYYQGTPGDEVIALIPKYEKSNRAAVERITNQ